MEVLGLVYQISKQNLAGARHAFYLNNMGWQSCLTFLGMHMYICIGNAVNPPKIRILPWQPPCTTVNDFSILVRDSYYYSHIVTASFLHNTA